MTAAEAEIEATEYMLGLEALGDELGRRARQTFDRIQARDVRPLLVRQQILLKSVAALADAGADLLRPDLVETDKKAAALDERIAVAWLGCLEQLKTLWLTSGRALGEES